MGILNVTPDSFSDGGLHFEKELAIQQALRMQEEGADILDIGGESTRPGAEKITAVEEINRVVPVIEAIASRVNIPISIDTYKAEVAEAALRAGAAIVNDISGLRFDPYMAGVVARHRVPVVLMHIKGTPENMQINPEYLDLIQEIIDYFEVSIALARDAGIAEDMIILDPGIGFGKTLQHNLEIIRRLADFSKLNKPILLGHSRKAFIGKILGDLPADQRLEGTAAIAAIGAVNGAGIIRVHDVKEMVRAVRVADAVRRGYNH
ncbi:MAG: dihydropteroate synthase [Nitrospira sp.]|nr:dihydropteroate synthase [bacterium]MBL7049182.1 dihydropteroate synthase [Nitrospira sp.]